MSDNEVEAEMETELHEGGVEETKGIEVNLKIRK